MITAIIANPNWGVPDIKASALAAQRSRARSWYKLAKNS